VGFAAIPAILIHLHLEVIILGIGGGLPQLEVEGNAVGVSLHGPNG